MTRTLVIGASRGIGLEFVRQCGARGDRVIATARSEEGLARLRALGADAFALDVADAASVSGLGWRLDGEKIDLAVYVAGVYSTAGALEPPTRAAFDAVMHVNVLGAMQAIPQVAPLVAAARGRFAFISSGMGRISDANSSFGWTYRVSKAALNMAVAAARHDYPGATFVAISPGWVQTDMGGPAAPLTPERSVAAMLATLSRITPRHSGEFLDYDGQRFDRW